jgi:hypothetical protein
LFVCHCFQLCQTDICLCKWKETKIFLKHKHTNKIYFTFKCLWPIFKKYSGIEKKAFFKKLTTYHMAKGSIFCLELFGLNKITDCKITTFLNRNWVGEFYYLQHPFCIISNINFNPVFFLLKIYNYWYLKLN